jgi:hypothetical protein
MVLVQSGGACGRLGYELHPSLVAATGDAGSALADAGVQPGSDAGCVSATYYADNDGDDQGDPNDAVVACAAPAKRVKTAGDCDDTTAFVHRGATEVCDRVDDDCDSAIDETGCPADATGIMWNGTPYTLLSTARTWIDARAACEAANMSMVELGDQSEQDRIWALAGQQTSWIGATDQTLEGEWLWNSGVQFWTGGLMGSPVAGRYANWLKTIEPQDSYPGEDCAAMFAQHGGRWADESCLTRSYPVICEGKR